MKIIMELNEKQANVIKDALEFYSRIQMGQFDEIDNLMSDTWKRRLSHEQAKYLESQLHHIYFPELHPFSYYGIFSAELPEDAKISWDIFQVLRNKMAWHRCPGGGITVDFDKPLPASNEELVRVRIEETGESE